MDESGNLYFYRQTSLSLGWLEPQIAKINTQGTLVWVLPLSAFGETPRLLGIDPAGNPIVFNTPVEGSTLGSSVITYQVEHFPTASAGPDQTLVENDPMDSDYYGSEPVTLDGSGSSDPDGTIVSLSTRTNTISPTRRSDLYWE